MGWNVLFAYHLERPKSRFRILGLKLLNFLISSVVAMSVIIWPIEHEFEGLAFRFDEIEIWPAKGASVATVEIEYMGGRLGGPLGPVLDL